MRSTHRTRRLLFALVTVAALLATACGQSSGDSGEREQRTIAYVAVVGNGGIETRFADAFRRAVESLGWKALYTDPGGNLQKAQQAIDGYLNQNVDAIMTLVYDPSVLQAQFRSAEAKDIPILLCCDDVEPAGGSQLDYTARYVPSEYKIGALMGQAFAEDFKGRRAKFGYIDSNQTFVGRQRQQGFIDEAKKAGMQLVGSVPVDIANAFQSSDQAAVALLRSHPDLDGAYAPFDFSGVSLAKAKRKLNMPDVKVYSAFADAANYPEMKTGDLNTVTEVDLVATMMLALDQLIRYFEDGTEFDPRALDDIDLHYEVIKAGVNVPPNDQGPYTKATVDSWITKWEQEFDLK